MARIIVKWISGTIGAIGFICLSAYAGYRYGTIAQFQDSLYCTAGNTRTYVSALEGLSSKDASEVVRLLEANVDTGIIFLTSTPNSMTTDRTGQYVKETLQLVRDHREKHPWTDESPALNERVRRALSEAH